MMGNHVLFTNKHALFMGNFIVFMHEIYKISLINK